MMHITKGKTRIHFDQHMKTDKGLVVGVEIVARFGATKGELAANATLKAGREMDINEFHALIGHPSFDTTEITAEYYGITLTGQGKPCEDCALAKSRQTNVPKSTETRSEVPGERFFIDGTHIKKKSIGGAKFWHLVVDDCTDFCWSFFLKKKSDQVDLILDLIKDVKAKYNYTVRYIRCDNAGENTSLEKKCLEQGLGITFEYTSPHSPQFNGRVERKFATLYTKVRCLLNGARVTLSLRHGLWAEAARAATDLENIVVTKRKGKDSHNAFCNKELPGLRNMHTFGEMGIVSYGRDTNKMKPKHMNRGRPCLYLGRAPNHPQDTFRFLNLDTHNIILSRDVTWLNKSYGTWKGLPVRVTKTNEGNEEEEDDWLAAPTQDPEEDDDGPRMKMKKKKYIILHLSYQQILLQSKSKKKNLMWFPKLRMMTQSQWQILAQEPAL